MGRADEIEKAARALLAALDASDDASIGIYAVASIHGLKYDGPTHGEQKRALRTALSLPPTGDDARGEPVAWAVYDADNVLWEVNMWLAWSNESAVSFPTQFRLCKAPCRVVPLFAPVAPRGGE